MAEFQTMYNFLFGGGFVAFNAWLMYLHKSNKEDSKKIITDLKKQIERISDKTAVMRLKDDCIHRHTKCEKDFNTKVEDLKKEFKEMRVEFKYIGDCFNKFLAIEETKKEFHAGKNGYMQRMDRIENNQESLLKEVKTILQKVLINK